MLEPWVHARFCSTSCANCVWVMLQAKSALAAALKDRYMPSFVGARFSFPAATKA
jgi:hypothetical protein